MLLSMSSESESSMTHAAEKTIRMQTPTQSLRHMLLVEDEFLIGLSIRHQLEQLGYRVTGPVAANDEAIAMIGGEPIDAALLDIRLRDGTSEPVARKLHDAGIPFLFVTGYQSPGLLPDDMQSIRRLRKPVDVKQLKSAIDELLTD
jgi:CheY-like chemotaxis protein